MAVNIQKILANPDESSVGNEWISFSQVSEMLI